MSLCLSTTNKSGFSIYLIRLPGQHAQLPPVEERDQKLPQGIFPPPPVWIRHHCVVSIVIVTKFQVVAEQDVGEGGALRVLLRSNCQAGLCHHDHHVRAGELLQESDNAEEVGDGEVIAGGAGQVEQVLREEGVLRDARSC